MFDPPPVSSHRPGTYLRQILTEQQLREGVARMAAEINGYYEGAPLTIIGVLTGSVILLADLIRLLDMPLRVGLVQATSYRGGTTPSDLRLNLDIVPDIAGRNVLIVDDIFDTGHTLAALMSHLGELCPVPCGRPYCCARRDGSRYRCSRTMWPSKSPTNSWSVTG